MRRGKMRTLGCTRAVMNFIGYIYLRAGLFVFFFLVALPLVIGLGWLGNLFLQSHQSLMTIEFLIAFPILLSSVSSSCVGISGTPLGDRVTIVT